MVADQVQSFGGSVVIVEVVTHAVLHVAKAVTAKVFATIPAGDDDDVVGEPLALKHSQDDHPCPAFAVIILDWRIVKDSRPGVVGGFGELLGAAQGFEGDLNVIA